MKANWKILSLAVVALVVLCALAATGQAHPGAHLRSINTVEDAGGVHTEVEEPGTIEAKGGGDVFTAFGLKVTCNKTEFTGTVPAPGGTTSLAVTPHYNECTTAGMPVTVTTNNCVLVLKLGETTGEGDTYGVTTDVLCNVGEKIEIHIYANATTHAEKKSLCTLTIPEQMGLKGLHATVNTAASPTDITISGTVKGVKVIRDLTGVFCPAGEDVNGEYQIGGAGLTVQVKNEAGKTIDLTIK